MLGVGQFVWLRFYSTEYSDDLYVSLLTCFGLKMDENGIMILHQIDDCQFMGHIHINDIKLDDLQSVQQESCDIFFLTLKLAARPPRSGNLGVALGVPCVICFGEEGVLKTLHCGFKAHMYQGGKPPQWQVFCLFRKLN